MSSLKLSDEFIESFKIQKYDFMKKGGQKTVFAVKINNKPYALKLLNFLDERLTREIDIYSKYTKLEGIPKVASVKEFKGDTIILEEFIEGNDLNDITNSYKGDENSIISLILKIINILTPIWEDQYVHRDLKPQNIRITPDGEPVILDFGIARDLGEESLTATGGQPLTYRYASPEQYAGNKRLISYRTDFFCIGIIAYELYTNKLPFGSNRESINSKFKKNNLSVSLDSEVLDKFCNAVFKVNPSERPRLPENLKTILEQ